MEFFRKRFLFTPGPVEVPPKALLTQAQPITHHRLPEFSQVLREIRENLKYLFQTEERVYFFASSGTGAMEAAILNLFSPGDKVLVIVGGKFGERWYELAKTFGLKTIVIELEWGRAIAPDEVKKILEVHPEIKGVLMQACETSTGVKHPVREIAKLIKEREETILVVDAISALGVFELPMDLWGIDVMITGSQKALSLPPGLSFIALSKKAKKFLEKSTLPKYYFNILKEDKAYDKDTTAYTPAVSLLMALNENLKRIKEIGLGRFFDFYKKISEACREAVKSIGLSIFPEVPAESLTVIKTPENFDTGGFLKFLREELGVVFAGGQAHLKGKIFRITHMGYQSAFDLMIALSAMEVGLKKFGYSFEEGKSLQTAQKFLINLF